MSGQIKPRTGGRERARAGATLPFSRHVLWHGRDEPPIPVRGLSCGPLDFDLEVVDLARVRAGSTELVNRIYMSVRDRNWDTVLPVISDLRVNEATDGSVSTTFTARNRAAGIDLEWQGSIVATPDGRCVYGMRGVALTDFTYCRIGFCLLFAEEAAAGRAYRADTPRGQMSGMLPRLIAPQTIVDGREVPLIPKCSALELDLDGLGVRVAFEGGLFGSEDQRNWTDASFKVCYDGETQYPYDATRGQIFEQRVELTMPSSGIPVARRRSVAPSAHRISFDPTSHEAALPAIGLAMRSDGRRATPRELARLAALHLDHLRVDLHLVSPDWPDGLARAVAISEVIGAGLEIAVFVDDRGTRELDRLATALGGTAGPPRPVVARVLVLPEWTPEQRTTTPDVMRRATASLAHRLPGVSLVGGTDGDFAELNRDRPVTDGWAGVSYSINPQVHAFDDGSLASTLVTQGTTVATTRSFAGSLPVVVSPVTLRQRFNPSATEEPAPVAPGELPPSVDPRQLSLFGAGWTLGSIASLGRNAAASVTYYETAGWRGVMAGGGGGSRSADFPSRAGMVYPMYHVFADLAHCRTAIPVELGAAEPDRLAALAVRAGSGIRILVANLTAIPTTVILDNVDGKAASARILDDHTAAEALLRPIWFRRRMDRTGVRRGQVRLSLGPFAYARVDATAES